MLSARPISRAEADAAGLFVVGPHADKFDDAVFFQNLIDQPMVDVDATGISACQIPDQLFCMRDSVRAPADLSTLRQGADCRSAGEKWRQILFSGKLGAGGWDSMEKSSLILIDLFF